MGVEIVEKTYTHRGFAVFGFTDGNGEKASVQQSSAAEAPHVWLGVDELKLRRFVPGQSWSDCPLPEGDIQGNERLHLTRENVQDLIPILQRFVDTGDIDDAGESVSCSTPSSDTVVPPDRETWDILCAYLAGEEHHGSEISEGRLTEILEHRLGWGRFEVRAAWFDAVARGKALIEADHERVRPLREAEAARLLAEAGRRKAAEAPTEPGSSS